VIIIVSATGQAQETINDLRFVKSDQTFSAMASTGVFLEDIDADRDFDAVISNFGQSLVLKNDGAGRFVEVQQVESLHGVLVGDINMDGKDDLLSYPSTMIYLNNGRGEFKNIDNAAVRKSEQLDYCAHLVDLDNDDDLDVVTESVTGQLISWINDGSGQFKEGMFKLPANASFCDLNNDRAIDCIVRESKKQLVKTGGVEKWSDREGDVGYRLYLNDGNGRFEDFSFVSVPELVRSGNRWTWFFDFDNDGDMDIVFSDRESHLARILENDGKGNLRIGQSLTTVTYGKIGTGDLNNDEYIDLVITNRNEPAQIWINDRKGRFYDSGIRLEGNSLSQGCTIKDIDNDGDQDIFMIFYQRGSASIWYNQIVKDAYEY